MPTAVKICGINSPDILEVALDAGADYVGFVFFPKSPRHVDIETAASLVRQARDRAQSVALLVNPSDEDVLEIKAHVQPDMIQLHGAESPERVLEIKALSGLPILKAIGVSDRSDIQKAEDYQGTVDLILFDAKPPKEDKNALPGGNGLRFDWDILSNLADSQNFMLSGGLNPDNVALAIAKTGAYAVDVSSGVEQHPGKKDPSLIRQFILEARQ